MILSDEQAFHAAIAAAPLDDAPKLVFADWLDEHGRGREAAAWRLAAVAVHDSPYPAGATCPVPPPLPRERNPFPAPR